MDIGCGWGGFAKFAAGKYGCEVTGITISEEQIKFAKNFTKGLNVRIKYQDYSDLDEKFDKILVCGMMEHVGYKNYRKFIGRIRDSLNDGGIFLLHTIGRNTSSTFIDPWIAEYIFPNSMAPSIKQLASAVEGLFVVEDWHNFGQYYYQTLLSWYQNFDKNWHNIEKNYDSRFYRMWEYYFLSCAGAFKAREMQLWQIVMSKNGIVGGYTPVR